jgi:hypothetical protein
MPDEVDHLRTVGDIVKGLREIGLQPVLVGGMALVVLGSRRDRHGPWAWVGVGERSYRAHAVTRSHI